MTVVEPDAEEFEDQEEMLDQYPEAMVVAYIYTDPDQDYRGMQMTAAYDDIRKAVAKQGRIMRARADIPPEFAIWKDPQTGVSFIEDLLNDPSMVIRVSDLLLKKLSRLWMVTASAKEVQRLVTTDE
jgi:hypothetical protein